jgi:uncharacterized protein (TIGR02996 family)
LLRAIAAHPAEDTPRLMYADYLDELGGDSRTARAEFIRLHIHTSNLPYDAPEREAAITRLDHLLCEWDTLWQKEMPPGFRQLSGYSRGFPYRAAAIATAIREANDDPRLHGIRVLELEVDTVDLHTVFREPLFGRIAELTVRGHYLSWSGCRGLAESRFPLLESLSLARQRVGNLGVRFLCESWGLNKLRALDLSENDITDEGAQLLLDSHLVMRLHRLNLWGNRISRPLLDRLMNRVW